DSPAGALAMRVSMDQRCTEPSDASVASQRRCTTRGERPIASLMMRLPMRVTRSTEVVSLPSGATEPHVSALSRAQEVARSAATSDNRMRRDVLMNGPASGENQRSVIYEARLDSSGQGGGAERISARDERHSPTRPLHATPRGGVPIVPLANLIQEIGRASCRERG